MKRLICILLGVGLAWGDEAGDCRRRGLEAQLRGEFRTASEEFGAAIRLAPKVSSYYRCRAVAYEGLAHSTSDLTLREYYLKLGVADATQSCRLEPQLWKGYYLRAKLYSGSTRKDATRLALADCERAIRIAPAEELPHSLKKEIVVVNRVSSGRPQHLPLSR